MRAEILSDRGAVSPTLYIPGIDGTGELLLGTAARLEKSFRLVRFAYRTESGSSASTGSAKELDAYSDLARDISLRCREVGLGPCLVVAESFGGAVALQLALDHPQLVRGLVIVNSFAHFPARASLAWARLMTPLLPRFAFDWGRRNFAPYSLFGELREEQAIAEFRALSGAFFDRGYMQRLDMIAGLDLRPRLAELHQPVALVAGDRDRVVASVACHAEMARLLPNTTNEIVRGGGHLLLPLASQPWVERLTALEARVR